MPPVPTNDREHLLAPISVLMTSACLGYDAESYMMGRLPAELGMSNHPGSSHHPCLHRSTYSSFDGMPQHSVMLRSVLEFIIMAV